MDEEEAASPTLLGTDHLIARMVQDGYINVQQAIDFNQTAREAVVFATDNARNQDGQRMHFSPEAHDAIFVGAIIALVTQARKYSEE